MSYIDKPLQIIASCCEIAQTTQLKFKQILINMIYIRYCLCCIVIMYIHCFWYQLLSLGHV